MLRLEISRKFVAGWLTLSALQSLQQDYWGMEGTVRHVVNDWTSWKITVPIAILYLVIAIWLCRDPKPETTQPE